MNPFSILLVLIIVVPILEIYLLIKVGGLIGVLATILLIVLTAVLGAALLRQQGLATLNRFQANLGRGELPAIEILEGVALLIGGVLLLTPGFFTDAIGFLCLLPFSRKAIVYAILARLSLKFQAHVDQSAERRAGKGRIIEGEIIEKRDDSS
ncbi:MAG: FxsA family protein [Gammaproteobacteria bacterium]|nr:FxsA family protein [Gammaproteobacteria bacterium]